MKYYFTLICFFISFIIMTLEITLTWYILYCTANFLHTIQLHNPLAFLTKIINQGTGIQVTLTDIQKVTEFLTPSM